MAPHGECLGMWTGVMPDFHYKAVGMLEIYFNFSSSTETIVSPVFLKYPPKNWMQGQVQYSLKERGSRSSLLQNGTGINPDMITARVPLTVSEHFCVDLWIPKVYLWAKASEMSDGELLQSHPRDQWNLFDLK